MNQEAAPDTGRFRLRWIVLCGLGFGAGLAGSLSVAAPVEALVGMMLVTPVILALAGSVLGGAQWLAVGTSWRAGARWVGTSAIGLGVGMTLGIVLVETLGRAATGEQVQLLTVGLLGRLAGLMLVGTVAGLALGTAQWLASRASAPVGAPWVVCCTLGLGVGLPAGSLAADLLGGLQTAPGFLVFLAVAGLTAGLFTARGGARIAAGLPLRPVA